MQLSYVKLQVKDVAAVREWYVTRLDLHVVSETRDAVVLAGKDGGAALEIRKGRPLKDPERVVLAFNVKDVSVAFKRLQDAKLPSLVPPRKGDFGRTVATLKDPAGHTVEIFSLDLPGMDV
ncbi:MAG: hypothetical protein Kow00124_09590 [Anaerolineae bacterium]